jgi:hypothetical protein
VPRYFFNMRRDHICICDARGKECSGPAEAVEHAVVAALRLMGDTNRCRSWSGWSVDIESEAREHVATVPFAFAWEADLCPSRPQSK